MTSRKTMVVRCAAWALVGTLASPCPADVVYVDAGAPEGGDGASWETAFADLEAALAAADSGDELWVARGTYVPAGGRDASFRLRDGVGVYGGFAGDEIAREERDWMLNETVLSGDRAGDDGPDFENYGENCFHVVDADGAVDAVLDGFTLVGGAADEPGDRNGGGLLAIECGVVVRHCEFRANLAQQDGGAIYADLGASLTLEGCSFLHNQAGVGGAVNTSEIAGLAVADCLFDANLARTGGGAFFHLGDVPSTFTRCTFRDNVVDGIGGGLVGTRFTLTDCLFTGNQCTLRGGGLAASRTTLVNCAFSRNVAGIGGGFFAAREVVVINSTFANNQGGGVLLSESDHDMQIANSIFWGNSPSQIEGDPATVTYTSVEGGWPGVGNIDADPLFVQPGADDVRLSFGSPCLDAGSNGRVPEGVEFDLAGAPRIQNGTVDMGAYEGAYEPSPPRAEEEDVDDGEGVLLVPGGGGFEPERNLLVVFTNRSGTDDAEVSVTQYEENRHPDARGFSVLGDAAHLETSLDDGGFFAQVFIPFHEDDLDGADPFTLDVTYFDEGAGNWALAASRNTESSPNHRGPIGDRVAREGPGPWGVTLQVGDYGVYFDPQSGRGFAWANVDHAAEFSLGIALCPADAAQPPNSEVDFDDILVVIDHWGAGPGPYDVNDDGAVDAEDLIIVLSNWGSCE